MEKLFSEKYTRWLTSLVLICYILAVLSFPMALGVTYSGRSESPDHTLTYTINKLTWDSATGIDQNGVAEFDVFDSVYNNVASGNGENVTAPGTEGHSIVRLKNTVPGKIGYTAVLYAIRTNEALPVQAELTADGARETEAYTLPKGISEDQVIRAVTGTVEGRQIRDLDVTWLWEFYESDAQDAVDTQLGNAVEPDEITVGLYIVVEDNNNYVNPRTADSTPIGMYTGLMLISGAVLILLLLDWRREDEEEALEC